jgi:Rrf2 family protein
MALKLTKAGDYAIQAMLHLASLPEGTYAMRSEIARAQSSPSSFVAKILRRLVRAKLLTSSRGVHGGFSLARPPAEINFLQVIEAIEGPLRLVDCSHNGAGCSREPECPAASVWGLVENSMRHILSTTSLEELVSARRRNGRVDWVPRPELTMSC